jgi:ring-1,2-phenylacetyl-CoA epoxidase subunit PaaB
MTDWQLWEVFVRPGRGLSHVHAGSLRAADPDQALRHGRDLYTRRGEGVSLWVVPSADIHTSRGEDAFFGADDGKDYRTAAYYAESAKGVAQL